MGKMTIQDDVIWKKHIHDDAELLDLVARLSGGQTVALLVDGVRGEWCKMADGHDGRPTQGLRPLGRAKEFWRELYRDRRGDVVTVEVAQSPVATQRLHPALAQSAAEREAAFQALLAMAGQGWRSEGRVVSRDEMHDR